MGSSNSVVQAQKLVHQLRVEAGMERIKVKNRIICQCILFIYVLCLDKYLFSSEYM